MNVWMGDVDGDPKDELLYYKDGSFHVDGQDTLVENVNEWSYAAGYDGTTSKSAALNVNDDSPLLEYRDEHELRLRFHDRVRGGRGRRVTMGMSLSFQYGYEYWETNSESTFFEGTVRDIPSASFTPDLAYTFGLFAYAFEHEGQKFTVTSYWTE